MKSILDPLKIVLLHEFIHELVVSNVRTVLFHQDNFQFGQQSRIFLEQLRNATLTINHESVKVNARGCLNFLKRLGLDGCIRLRTRKTRRILHAERSSRNGAVKGLKLCLVRIAVYLNGWNHTLTRLDNKMLGRVLQKMIDDTTCDTVASADF